MLRTSELDYHLPESAIATTPAHPRDSARMLVVRRSDARFIEHARVRDLPSYLRAGDVMVVNATKVIAARLEGVRADTGGRVEGLYLGSGPTTDGARTWRVLLQGKRMKVGIVVALTTAQGDASDVRLHLLSRDDREHGAWLVRVERRGTAMQEADTRDADLLEAVGHTPLPPYIARARKHGGDALNAREDAERYQTVYAKDVATPAGHAELLQSANGSVAAPTAGLHFTPELLEKLRAQGVAREEVTLHVGLGTFKSVESEFVEQHAMHSERCLMPRSVRESIVRAKQENRRVLCVGTTATRTVESYAGLAAQAPSDWIDTNILISPGYSWQWTTAMLTNFHLPRSTLMAMIASLLGEAGGMSGVQRLRHHYECALREGYRFYSYGDAMLILE